MKRINILVNGYGRIGRLLHRILIDNPRLRVAAINSRAEADSHANLLKHDSTYGLLKENISYTKTGLKVNGDTIKVFVDKNPGEIDLKKEDIDIVAECTGKFKDRESCMRQLSAGAKKVVISAPGKDEDASIVLGVNEADYQPRVHQIISNASCTTNCLAPIVKLLMENFGLRQAQMTTIHAVTRSQSVVDGSNEKCPRRARSLLDSFIPTDTGAAKAIGKLFPKLEGKFNAMAVRVPFTTVSAVDLVVKLGKKTDVEKVNKMFETAAGGKMKGIVGITYEPLVSVDFKGEKRSAVIDGLLTSVVGGDLLKVFAWYDNEWGYTERLADLIRMVAKSI